ncbi:hypothetical protein ACIBH1_09345 [Nonomuraea sp. NPDC050663]|uniref:hypothetical protein n=1 Tax=Nonomuraea sp. NPDC050663 TaxID=3364370 RepID=UPI00379662A6
MKKVLAGLVIVAGVLAFPIVVYVGEAELACWLQQDVLDVALADVDWTEPQFPGAVPLAEPDYGCEPDDLWVTVDRSFRLPHDTTAEDLVAHHQRLAQRHGWRPAEPAPCLVMDADGHEFQLEVIPGGTRDYTVSVSTYPC